MGDKMRMLGKILFLPVLKDKETIRPQKRRCINTGFSLLIVTRSSPTFQFSIKYKIGQLGQLWKCIGWVGKYETIGSGSTAKEAEHISTQEGYVIFSLEDLQELSNKTDMLRVEFHGRHM